MVQSGALARGAGEIAKDAEGRGPIGVAAPDAPDIYLILLDGYPGTKARALDPSYPPSDLAAAARQPRVRHGSSDAHSNYLQTTIDRGIAPPDAPPRGLPELAATVGPGARRTSSACAMLLNDAPGIGALRGLGYRVRGDGVGVRRGRACVASIGLIEPVQPTEFEVGLDPRHRPGSSCSRTVAPDCCPGCSAIGSTRRSTPCALAAETHEAAEVRLRASPGAASAVGLRAVRGAALGSAYTFFNDWLGTDRSTA